MVVFEPTFFLLAFILGPIVGGGPSPDLLSLVAPDEYFASRRVEVRPAKMLQLASDSPADVRGGVQQLLAIRWLAENKGRLGEHQDAVRRALGRLADGPEGFARDHARIALARLDDKPTPVLGHAPKDSLREALAWFPADVNLAGVIDARAPAGQPSAAPRDGEAERQFLRLQARLLKVLPEDSREEVYRLVEAVGSCRIDRLAIGFAPDPGGSERGRLFIRATGRMDHKRMAAYLREKLGDNVTLAEKKGPRGEPITVLAGEHPPAFVLVDDGDLVMTGYLSDYVNCTKLAEDVLAVRAGGRPSFLTSPAGKTLRDIPAGARGLVRGGPPQEIITGLARSPLGAAPRQVTVDLLSPDGGLDLHVRGTLDSEADARRFAAGLRDEIGQVVEALKELPLVAQLGGVATIRKVVEGIEVKADGRDVTARVAVPAAAIKTMLRMLETAMPSSPEKVPNGG
jgi:hypothetical protein